MVRISGSVASILAGVSLALATSGAAQVQTPRPAAPPPRAVTAAPPPRMVAPPPHMAPPMAAPAPRMAVSPGPAPHIAAPQRGPALVSPPSSTRQFIAPQYRPGGQQPTSWTERRSPSAPAQVSDRQTERQLRAQQNQERADQRAQQLQQRLEQRAQRGRLGRSEQRLLRNLQGEQDQRQQRAQIREQMRQPLPQQRQEQDVEARQSRRTARQARITPGAAAENRFAGRFLHDHRGRDQWLQARREGWGAREAWRHRIRAAFIPWFGPIYWPYAYSDIFCYTFWPYAYDDRYWAYVYDDFVDGIFFPYGAPYLGDANGGPYATYNGPYDTGGSISVGSRAERIAPIGSVSTAARQLCEDPGTGVTAWPIDQIIETVQPNEEQRTLLDDLKNAAVRAADAFRNACPTAVPMTPVSRLQAMIGRLEATLEAITVVRPMLEKFYDSLSDEQKARFNAMEADVEEQAPETRQPTNACANAKPGLADLPIDRIDEVVRPTGDQEDALDRLSNSTQKAVETLRAACPHSTPLTPVGRLEVMEQRLNAILTAAKTIQPALEDFYGSLNNEQKARFNTLDRSFARGT